MVRFLAQRRRPADARHTLAILTVLLLGVVLGLPQGAQAQNLGTTNSEPRFPPLERGLRTVAENTAAGSAIGAPLAATDADDDRLAYAIAGDDAGFFSFDTSTGQLMTRAALDHEDKNRYQSLTVSVHDGKDAQGNPDTSIDAQLEVSVLVINVEEAGSVSLWPARPRVGAVLRADLSDPDRVRYRFWEWSSSADKQDWTVVRALGYDAHYAPGPSDRGRYLRAVAEYTDHEGGGKSAEAATTYRVGDATPAPELVVTTLVSGLTIPWDIAFAPDGTMLFTERGGRLSARTTDGAVQAVAADLGDLRVVGETGLMAIVVDPAFATNRRFYTCQGHTGPEVQVIAWRINDAYTTATRVADPLVGGILAGSLGGHAGCRLRFGPQGHLWISIGDAGPDGSVPQSLTALGGKILRVHPSTGAGVRQNPFSSSPLVYSYGHRNPQGLARRPGTSQMWSVEHGPRKDDEINLLARGGNYGWDPVDPDSDGSYYDIAPMTDLVKFPGAIEAGWSSGTPTLATSGGIFLEGDAWGRWEGWLAVASLADSTLRVFEFSPSGDFLNEVVVSELDGYGRLRTPMMGPDGALYVTTSNGGGADRILRVAPRQPLVLTGPPSVSYTEGGTDPVATYTARATGATITWRLLGDDATAFRLDGGVLRGRVLHFRMPPDYETPLDVDGDNRYDLKIHASDGIDSREVDITVAVTAPPVIRPPVITPPVIRPPVITPPVITPPVITAPAITAPAITPPTTITVPQSVKTFVDDDGSVHEAAIEYIATEGITVGCNPPAGDRYCPDRPVTRAQMASFLRRALDLAVPDESAGFADVDPAGVHAPAIDALRRAGITVGCNPPAGDRYCPDRPVTRAQMASFLRRALDLAVPDESAGFADVDPAGVHAPAIDALRRAGITVGCGIDPLRYCPDRPVTRAQMASFLQRALTRARN